MAYKCHNTTNRNFYFTCYCKICARNIYAHQISGIYAKYTAPFIRDANHAAEHCIRIWLDKCGCHIPNIAHIANMLNGHIDPALLHIYHNRTNCNLYFTYHCQVCVRNEYAHQAGLIRHTWQISDEYIWGHKHIYMAHMKHVY